MPGSMEDTLPGTPAPAPARSCPSGTGPPAVADVVVIGGGALGAATGWLLARAGTSVVLLHEQSGRELRRAARGTAWSAHPSWLPPEQAALLAEAVRLWRALERETGATLLSRGDAVDHGDPDLLAAAGSAEGAWLARGRRRSGGPARPSPGRCCCAPAPRCRCGPTTPSPP